MDFIFSHFKTIITAALIVGGLLLVIKFHKKIKTFLLEVRQELGKVSWSNREELIGSTAVVITVTAIMAVFIGVIDLVLSKSLTILLK